MGVGHCVQQAAPQASAHRRWLTGADLCRDAQSLQDALLGDVITWGLLDKVQQNFVTTCTRRQMVRAHWEAT